MRINYFWLPLLAIASLVLLSACSGPGWFNPNKIHQPRPGISGSWKYNMGSGAYRRWNRDKSQSGSYTPSFQETGSTSSWMTQPQTGTWESTGSIVKTVSYQTPEWPVTAVFSIGIAADKTITSVHVSSDTREHESQERIASFNQASVRDIVGKKIGSLLLDSIGWSSLTTWAFNQLIKTI